MQTRWNRKLWSITDFKDLIDLTKGSGMNGAYSISFEGRVDEDAFLCSVFFKARLG